MAIVLLGFSGIKAATNMLGHMGDQEVSSNEVFEQNIINSKGQGFFDIIDAKLLEKDYSVEKNQQVKAQVDTALNEVKSSETDLVKEYGAKDAMDYLKLSGQILKIQRDEYAKAAYEKEFVTEKSLKDLYNARKGELISYSVIKVDANLLNNDAKTIDDFNKDVQARLEKADAKDLKKEFKAINEKYFSGTESEYDGVSREQVDQALLSEIDKLKQNEATMKPVEVNGEQYYILKTSSDERAPFDTLKEKLKGIQYQEASSANQYLNDYLLVQLRQKNNIEFKDGTYKKIYDSAINQVIKEYNEAQKQAGEQ